MTDLDLPSKAHCATCGYPCCAGAEEHADHGGSFPDDRPQTASIAIAGKVVSVPIPDRPADPDDDDPIDAGLGAVRYEGVFGRRPGE